MCVKIPLKIYFKSKNNPQHFQNTFLTHMYKYARYLFTKYKTGTKKFQKYLQSKDSDK